MKIARITILNCQNVCDIDAVVGDHLVLVGPNASGKTSVLRLLDAALNWGHFRLGNDLTLSMLRDRLQPLLCKVVLNDFDALEAAAFADEIELVGPTEVPQLTIELSVFPSAQDLDDLEITRHFIKVGVRPIVVTSGHLKKFSWHLLHADRNAERELKSTGIGAVGQLLRAIDLGADEAAVAKAFAVVDQVLDSATSLKALRSEVANALSSVFPKDVDAAQVSIGLPSTQDPLRNVDVTLTTVNTPNAFSLLEQSDGMRSLSVMSLQILSHGDSAITGIDEPEIHLHPRSQARVSRLFARPGGQRVIATHSATVVRCFQPSHVVVLTHRGARQLEGAAVTANPKFFSQWWVEDMIEPLTSRSLILVEGPSEEIITRRVAELRGINLDREDISIVSLGAANNFPNAYNLFGPNGFNIAVSSLVDKAEAHLLASTLGVNEDQLATNNVVICDADLENEYIRALGSARTVELLTNSELGFVGVDEANVVARCGGQQKVKAALAIERGMTVAEAKRIGPINALIDRALKQQ